MPQQIGIVSYEPIVAVRTLASAAAFPAMERHTEAASLTNPRGIPMMLDGSGNLVEWTTGAPNIIYGFSAEPAHNLAVAATAQDLSEGKPQNQPSAITTPVGAWPRDGKIGVYQANGLSVFSAALKIGQVFTSALLIAGTFYDLVKDAGTGFWYVDNTATGGNSGVVNLLGVDPSCPNDAVLGTRVFFTLNSAKRYFV